MSELKLPRLPDRKPVKLTIAVLPELHQALLDYAGVYAEVYGEEESVSELIPAMLAGFLASDRVFAKARKTDRASS
ncbi:DUF2274 domain-containing protein [Sphingomonas gilva]|uniref:DUF2274 domain-containing protein n=1 Tax=Sphingomonas gilva TaxID=2305907 RepID=A0A396RQE6_9SPHN|nr:DUF2274 domain-containing protein [Sphingomonas gilva]RHW18166.1 DUF2274 domain-containing protein [Sphingomonas gilva]